MRKALESVENVKAVAVLALFTFHFSLFAFSDELDVARQALRDGLWDIARSHAAKLEDDEAKLIVLESLAGEGRWDEVARTLEKWPEAKAAGFDYYRAVLKGDHAAAVAALKKGGSSDGLVEAKLHEAEALSKAGKRAEATALWRELAAATNAGERALAVASENLADVKLLRKAYAEVNALALRREVGIRLGAVLLRDATTMEEGERLIQAIVKDSPDTNGAKEAYLGIVNARLTAGQCKEAIDFSRMAIEIWPDVSKNAALQESRGWALKTLGRREEALEAFRLAGEFAADEASKATALVKEGDVLSDMGRSKAAMSRYREVMEKFPKTTVAEQLKAVLKVRGMEAAGRRLYGEFRYGEAMKEFERVAEADSSRRQRMNFFAVLCLYGQGQDEAAAAKAREIVGNSPDPSVRADALMWLAKFLYNRREWRESGKLFAAYESASAVAERSAEALLWASRAALADNDFDQAIQLTTRLLDRYPGTPSKAGALLVQGEALVELARFDEAVLVFERVALAEGVRAEERMRALVLKADALFAMGADNSNRYAEALEAYRAVRFGGSLSPSGQLVVAFKIARALDRLKRVDEANDQYYSQVVIAYREGRLRGIRYNDEARALFSRAAFRLADEYEGRGRDRQALHVLELLAASDVPASDEAKRRMEKISNRGRFL